MKRYEDPINRECNKLRLIEFGGHLRKLEPSFRTSRTWQENLEDSNQCTSNDAVKAQKITGCTSNDTIEAHKITEYAIAICPFLRNAVHDARKGQTL